MQKQTIFSIMAIQEVLNMLASATTLSNNILLRARRENIDVTPMKLQKLLYYVCVKYLQETGRSPISERFEVWKYGPVLPSVYAEFKPFGSGKIDGFALNAKGKAVIVGENNAPILQRCIDYVWNKLKRYSAIELSERTHQRGSGWYSAFQEDRTMITEEDMKNDSTL